MLSSLFSLQPRRITQPQDECVWQDLVYALKVSKRRRSIGFQVRPGGITVTVPLGLEQRLLAEALAAKYAWLVAKQEQLQERIDEAKALPDQLRDGDQWPLFGDWLPIRISEAKHHSISLANEAIELVFTSRQRSQACRWRLWQQWYRQQALAFVQQRLDYWLGQMEAELSVQPASIKVRQYSSRWGSCNSRAELTFNYLLAMAPKDVFDCVVVHEMCHLKHLHHGAEFWQLVTSYCPAWQTQRQWLKQHGSGLLMELST